MFLNRFVPIGTSLFAAGVVAAAAAAMPLPAAPPASPPAAAPHPIADDVNAALNLRASTAVQLDVDPALVGLAIQINLPIEGLNYRLDLWPHSVRGEGFRLIEWLGDGVEREVDPGPVNTLRGEILGMPGSTIAGGVMPDGLYLTVIFPDGRQFWLEPIVGRVEGARASDYALYRAGDTFGGGFCGTTNDQVHGGDGMDLPPAPAGPRGNTTYVAQMGTDADYEYFLRWGGVINVNSRIALVTNTMNLQFERDVDIRHVITTTVVRAAHPDVYTTSDPATLNAQIATAWTAMGFSSVDVIQLFTHRAIDGNVIGRANAIGSVCGNQNSNCWSRSDWSNNFSSATDLSAHELGHLWNAVHCTCADPPSTMNPSNTAVNRFGVNANDTAGTRIPAYRNTRGCLTTLSGGLRPPNDDCANAVRLLPGTYGYNNFNATFNGPFVSCTAPLSDIWYLYIAPCNGTVTFDTCFENALDSVLVAHVGNCGDLIELACNDDTVPCPGGVGTLQSRISFAVTAGTTYRIRIGNPDGATGFGYLTVTQTPCAAPVNNFCISAISLPSNIDVAFSTYGATTDGPIDYLCWLNNDQTVGNDIWYTWSAPCTEVATVSLCGSSFDTKLALYTSCPTSPNQATACNDNACGLQSEISFFATAGVAYRFRVGGYNNSAGVGTIRVNSSCVPIVNDNCANAINVSAGGTFAGTLVGATSDGTATCGQSEGNPDVWYAFTAPAGSGGDLWVSTCGTHDGPGVDLGMDTVLSVRTACGGAQIVCNDDTQLCGTLDLGSRRDSGAVVPLSGGQSVRIRISKWSQNPAGPFVLRVLWTPRDSSSPWTAAVLHPVGAGHSGLYGVHAGLQVGWAFVSNQWHAGVWSGTPATWVNLHPAGATFSIARGSYLGSQVGNATIGGVSRAGRWSGTAASWVDLSPAGSASSEAWAMHGNQQVGRATFSFQSRAGLWTGTAASWVSLDPPGSIKSLAFGVHEGRQVGYAIVGGESRASLWSGTAASWVNLHPANAISSVARGIEGEQQVGCVNIANVTIAAMWNGDAASWQSLHPPAASQSRTYGIHDGQQVGYADVGGRSRASLWAGTADSWEDLSLALPGSWEYSYAHSIWSSPTTTYIAGYGRNLATGREEAILWTRARPSTCRPDWNGDDQVNSNDISAFLTAWLASIQSGTLDADFNGDNAVNSNDISAFLTAWLTAVSGGC